MSSTVIAATLDITVLEKGSGDVIENANVVDLQTSAVEITDGKGKATLGDVNFPVTLKVLAIGHETKQETITTATTSLIMYIEPLPGAGDSLDVVADRVQQKISKVVVSKEELKRVPGSQGDPIRAVRNVPGVIPSSEFNGNFYVRGSSGEDNLFWVNRMPIGYLFHFFPVSVVNPDVINDFNILLGGFSSEYDNVLGGVVDIQLHPPRGDKWRKKLRVALNESAFSMEGGLGEPSGPLTYFFSVRKSYIDVLLTPDTINRLAGNNSADSNSVITLPKYYDSQAMLRYELDRGSLELIYLNAADALAFNIKNVEDSSPELRGELGIRNAFYTTGMNWRQRWSSQARSIVTVSTQKFKQHFQIGSDPVTGEPYYIDGVYRTSHLHPELEFDVSPSSVFTAGTDLSYGVYPIDAYSTPRPSDEEEQSDFSVANKYRVATTLRVASYSPYLKYRARVSDKLSSTLGLRFARYFGSADYDTTGMMPRAALEYELTNAVTLTSAWGLYMQPPRQSDIVQGIGNPGLVMTKAEHRIVGIKYRYDPLWTIDLEAYQKPMWDLVYAVKNQSAPNNYQNIGSGDVYGVDFYLKRDFVEGKFGWLSLSYINAKRYNSVLAEQRRFSGDQPVSLTALWSQPLLGSWKKWTYGVKLEARSGKPYTPVIGRTALCRVGNAYVDCADQNTAEQNDATFSHWVAEQGKQNSRRLPVYYKIDMRFDRDIRFDNWKMNFYVDLQNVTFRENITSYDYGKNYVNYQNPKPVAFLPFILPFVGIEAQF